MRGAAQVLQKGKQEDRGCVHALARFATKKELSGGKNRSGRPVRTESRCTLPPGHERAGQPHRTADGREWL